MPPGAAGGTGLLRATMRAAQALMRVSARASSAPLRVAPSVMRLLSTDAATGGAGPAGRKRVVDMRSDTVTRPDAAMTIAMMDAKVGDDVMGEDVPTNTLEKVAAERLGKEAALFVPSGTMANLAALVTHTRMNGGPGEAIVGDESHIFHYEGGGAAAVAGLTLHTLPTQADGTLTLESLRSAVRDASDAHYAETRLVALENTHNRCGGAPLTAEYTAAVGEFCREIGVPLHIDGARLFNASVALNVSVEDLARPADSINICLSKGLGAPVGSVLVGSSDFIREARRVRKMLGGGMRQCGVLAAAGMIALNTEPAVLQQDHNNARVLAATLAGLDGISVSMAAVRTNIIYFDVDAAIGGAAAFVEACRNRGVLIGEYGTERCRLVTHKQVTADDVSVAMERLQQAAEDLHARA